MNINFIKFFYLVIALSSCQAQSTKRVGGPCEGCEAIHEYGNKHLAHIDTLPGFAFHQPQMKITGTVFRHDGRTPARDVIIYIYHTDRNGLYAKKGNEQGWARRHGYIRGWVKTGADGRYTFYSFRPAAYPDRSEPEHIHVTIKEPDKNEYYLDDFVFDDDALLTRERRNKLTNRGGSGIVTPRRQAGMLLVERDIILGKNIPDYD